MAEAQTNDIFTRRVCLRMDGMEAVPVRRDLDYGPPHPDHRFDIYYPHGASQSGCWPVVIIVAGYPGTLQPRPTPLSFKEMGWTVSMCQLIAASGMAAIAYTNRDPVSDLQALYQHVHAHAEALQIDPRHIGVLATSGSGPTGLATIMRDSRRAPACAVFGYAFLLDLEGDTRVAGAASQFGFANPCAGRAVADLRRDVPLLITRAGRDQFPGVNAAIDRFITAGLRENLPITLVNHAEGPHAYDLFDDGPASRSVVRQTLRFLRQHLGE
jgi:acetyl esterase/lipase